MSDNKERRDIERRAAVDELLEMKSDIEMLVRLLKDVESFLRILATLGKALKWTAGIAAACFGAWAAYKGISHR